MCMFVRNSTLCLLGAVINCLSCENLVVNKQDFIEATDT